MGLRRAFSLRYSKPKRITVDVDCKIDIQNMALSPREADMLKRSLSAAMMVAMADANYLHCYVSEIKVKGIK